MRIVGAARARYWFWAMTVVAILAAGVLSHALTAEPSVLTGLQVAGSGLVLAVSGALATRVLLALTGTPKRPRWPVRRRQP